MSGALGRVGRQRGSVAVEMVAVFFPIAATMALLAVFVARLAGTDLDLHATAAAAARAASQARTAPAAQAAARRTASAALATHARSCTHLAVVLDASSWHRGGQASITLTCRMNVADLTGLGLPGALTGSATGHAFIDTRRAISTGTGTP